MGCGCNEKKYSISMGCCQPVLGPIENYYTKPQIDKMIEEIESAVTSGCCITEEEVDEKIESAKTEIEAEIPSLSGYATEQWVQDQGYITGVDLSNYATKSEIPVVPTSNTAFTNDAGYLTEHQPIKTINGQSLIGTGDIEIGTGGTIDLSNYYTTAETKSLVESAVTVVEGEIPTIPTSNTAFTNDAGYLTEHQSLSGYATEQWVLNQNYITGVDLSNYATEDFALTLAKDVHNEVQEVDGKVQTISGNVRTISGDVQVANAHLSFIDNVIGTLENGLTAHTADTSIHFTTGAVQTQINNSISGKQNTLTPGSGISIQNDEISTKVGNGLRYTQDGTLEVNSTNAIATGNTQVPLSYVVYNYVNNNCMMKSQIWCGTQAEYDAITTKDNNVIYLIYD